MDVKKGKDMAIINFIKFNDTINQIKDIIRTEIDAGNFEEHPEFVIAKIRETLNKNFGMTPELESSIKETEYIGYYISTLKNYFSSHRTCDEEMLEDTAVNLTSEAITFRKSVIKVAEKSLNDIVDGYIKIHPESAVNRGLLEVYLASKLKKAL